MSSRDPEGLLALAAELDARDAQLAERLGLVRELLEGADEVRARAEGIAGFLDALPAERELLARSAADADARRDDALATLAAAERRRAELAERRRAGERERARAEAEVARARAELDDAEARVARLAEQRRELDEAELARRAEAGRLAAEGRSLAARIRQAPRVSEAGRAGPGPGLGGLAEWGSRAHAALFVVRGGLEAERERVAREASELGAAVLGEPPLGASVAAVRRRVEQALGAA